MPESRIEEILRADSIKAMNLEPADSIPASTRLRDVIATMQKKRSSAVVIVENDKVVGIFTERDLLNRIVGLALNEDLLISDVMTANPRTLGPDDRIADAIHLMTDRGYRHIPLVDDNSKNVGLLSARHIVEFIAEHYPQEVFNLPSDLDQIHRRPEGG